MEGLEQQRRDGDVDVQRRRERVEHSRALVSSSGSRQEPRGAEGHLDQRIDELPTMRWVTWRVHRGPEPRRAGS